MTDVFITVDVEFSAAGYWADPDKKPVEDVDFAVDGEAQGLGFILSAMGRHGIVGTFFVETAHLRTLDTTAMGAVAARLRDAGQDVQLHLHPMWLTEDRANVDDRMAGRDEEFLRGIFRQGKEAFAAWGVPAPTVFRAGNLMVDAAVYGAMADEGIPVGSNIGLGVVRPAEPELQLCSGRRRIGGAVEVPILSYEAYRVGRGTTLRTLTITGASFGETKWLLEAAHARGFQEVVILTHAHEFIKARDVRFETRRKNRVNQDRLERLCRYLADNRDRFATPGMGACVDRWTAAPDAESVTLKVPVRHALQRTMVNALNDSVWWI